MTDQVQGYTFEYAYSNAIIKSFSTQVQPAYPIEFNPDSGGNLYIQNLNSSSAGNYNVAIGYSALSSNLEGISNTAIGYNALFNNTAGTGNTAIGYNALYNTNENENTGIGYNALFNNTKGYSNIAIGYNALFNNTAGDNNIAIGSNALYFANVNNNICLNNNNSREANIYPLNNGAYGNNELLIAPNVGLIGGVDNNTYDTTSSTIVPATSSYIIIYGELATSFGGTAPTSITAGASPYTLTPSSTTNQIVIISGGSVSSVELNGTTTGLTSGTFYCRAGDSLTITYSTAPTILQYNV